MPANNYDDEISIKDIIDSVGDWYRYLLSKWVIILMSGLLGGAMGILYATLKKPVYTAEATFVLEEEGKGGLSQYAGLASMVGIDLGSGGGGLFQGDNIIQLYKSRSMIEKTLLSKVMADNKNELLIDRYIGYNKLREKWAEKPGLQDLDFSSSSFTIKHDSIIGMIVKDINENFLSVVKPDKKLSIISVQVKSKDEFFAKAFTDKIVENVNSFYVQTRTKKSLENIAILQRQADSVRRVLNASIGNTAAAVDVNPNANSAMQSLRVPSQRRQIDVQASTAIYSEIVKNLEISKISLRKETPLIQVIDKPVLPLEKSKVGRLKGLVIGGFIGGFLIVLFLVLKRFYANLVR